MNPEHVSILLRMEATRRFRSFFGARYRVAILAVAGVFLLLPAGIVVFGAHYLGGALAGGNADVSIEMVRAVGGGAVLAVALMSTIRTVQTAAVPANVDGLLTTATHREVVLSVVVVEVLTSGGVFGVFGLLGAVAFGVGAGSPLAGLWAAVAVVCVLVLGTVLGLAIGFAVRNGIARSEFLARYKTAIGVLLFVAYFATITASGSEASESAFETIGSALGSTPLGWFGDLALLGVGTLADPALGGGALGFTVLGAVVCVASIDRLATLLWYETAVEGSRKTGESADMGDFAGVPRPVARVARKAWLRAWRSPIRLLYVAYPLFLLIEPVSEAVQSGVVPAYLPATMALYGGWATGAAFTLNPIGDETEVLPVTLTTPVSGRTFMAGCSLAGVAIGVPFTAILSTVLAVAAGLPPASIVLAAVLGVVVPGGATLLATGIGALFPRLEAVNVVRGRKAVVPSLFGFAVYSLALSLLSAPAFVVAIPSVREALVGNAGSPVLLAVGAAATTLLLGVSGVLSFRYAAGRFDRYTLD